MGLPRIVLAAGVLLASAPALRAAGDFAYVPTARPALDAGAVVIDTRPSGACTQESLAGARCLAAAELFGPQRRLPSYRDILWLFGTIGLRGHETALVVGQDPVARDFVAGLLYLAGQARVLILTQPVGRALSEGVAAAPGRPRSFTREAVYEAPMRDALVVLSRELRAREPMPPLLDGRSTEEYRGESIRGARGGHLPGAVSLPATGLRTGQRMGNVPLPAGAVAAYGHDAYEGIAYFTQLRAGLGARARVFPGGWAEWAAAGRSPS